MGFVNLHTHSHFSLMDSIAKPKEIVSTVKYLGQTAVALTDHGCTSGLIEMYKECKKQDIKFIFGLEAYLTHDVTIKEDGYRHICLWAKNEVGYKNLLKLSTLGNQNFYRKPRIDINILRDCSEGLIVSSACLGGWLRTKDGEINRSLLKQITKIFPNDLYIELHTYSVDEQKQWNLQLIELANTYNFPVIAACDAHYATKDQHLIHKHWLTQGKEREDGYYQYPDFYLHSEDEVREKLSYLPQHIVEQSIVNTQVIADMCNVDIKFGEQHYPKVNVQNQREAIMNICRKNWPKKVPDKSQWKSHKDRILYELPVLEKANYFPYFLIMHDIMENCCEAKGIPIGFSRGSAGGCDTGFMMDIHKTDSVKFDLMFERFLHEERISPCDIDIDVSQERRDEVIQYIKDKYGHDRVFQARTYGYMAARGALKRAGKSLGYDPQYIIELSKGIPKYDENDYKGDAKERHLLDLIYKPEIGELVNLAKAFVGILQNYSVHASGVIVFPDDPNNYCAIEKSGDNFVTAYEFKTLESLGILKLDILGIKTADVIANTLKLIPNIDLENLPLDDQKTFDMLCEGKTAGVFQVEGAGFTQLVRKVQPKHFEELAPLMAVYRPAIIDAGLLDVYIKRKTGEETIEYLHPVLEPILSPTQGICLYQEQMLAIAKTICGYTLGQADLIRRACGKKLPEDMAKIRPDFISRAIANGYQEDVSVKLWEFIEFFAGYGFGKAHSYGYGYLSYATAYLKANYTKEFMVSLINSEKKQEDILLYITECKALGIQVLPPSLKLKNTQWEIEGDSIRIGLHYIKGIGKNLKTDNVDAFADIVRDNSKNVTEGLIKSGALDYLGVERPVMLGNLQSLQELLNRQQQCLEKIEENERQLNLYIEVSRGTTDEKQLKETQKYITKHDRQLQQWQKKLQECQAKAAVNTTESYDETAGECEVLGFSFRSIPKVITGKITNIYSKNDKNKKEMSWITFSSAYGEIKSTVFQDAWSRIKGKVAVGGSYVFANDSKNILQEIKIGEQLYDFRRKWGK